MSFSHVFKPDAQQESVFTTAVEPVVESFLAGHDGLVFAYGITNAGKTHTIRGTSKAPGVLPRALNTIFSKLSAIPNATVRVSHLEIYNEQYYDLLVALPDMTWKRPTLTWRNGKPAKLKHIPVTSSTEALEQLSIGSKNRSKAQTTLNCDSSRSHSVFSIVVQGLPGLPPKKNVKLSIVDLAGSERAKRTNNGGALLTEAGNINLSLMNLNKCFKTLRWNQQNSGGILTGDKIAKQVPYRGSKLTKIFQKSFQGSGHIVMIVAASTTPEDYDETLQVLKKAALAKRVKGEGKSRVQHTNAAYDKNGRRKRAKTTKDLQHRFRRRKRSLSVDNAIGRTAKKPEVENEEEEEDVSAPPPMRPKPLFDDEEEDDEKEDGEKEDGEKENDEKEDDEEEDIDLDQFEDEIRGECQEQLEQVLLEHDRELKRKEQEWKMKLEHEVTKVMALLQNAQSVVSQATTQAEIVDNQKSIVIANQKEMVQDCEEEINRHRSATVHKMSLLKKTQQELEDTTDRLMDTEEQLKTSQQEHQKLLQENEKICEQAVAAAGKKDYKLKQVTKEKEQHLLEMKALKEQLATSEEAREALSASAGQHNAHNGSLQQEINTITTATEHQMKEKNKIIAELHTKVEETQQNLAVVNLERERLIEQGLEEQKAMNTQLLTELTSIKEEKTLLADQMANVLEEKKKQETHYDETLKEKLVLVKELQDKVKVAEKKSADAVAATTSVSEGDKFQAVTSRLELELKQAQESIDALEEIRIQQDDEFSIRQENLEKEHMTDLAEFRNKQNDLEQERDQLSATAKKNKATHATEVSALHAQVVQLKATIALKDDRIDSLTVPVASTTPPSSPSSSELSSASKQVEKSSSSSKHSESSENSDTAGNQSPIKEKRKKGKRFGWLMGGKKKSTTKNAGVASRTRSRK